MDFDVDTDGKDIRTIAEIIFEGLKTLDRRATQI
jgi:hypothetical protein